MVWTWRCRPALRRWVAGVGRRPAGAVAGPRSARVGRRADRGPARARGDRLRGHEGFEAVGRAFELSLAALWAGAAVCVVSARRNRERQILAARLRGRGLDRDRRRARRRRLCGSAPLRGARRRRSSACSERSGSPGWGWLPSPASPADRRRLALVAGLALLAASRCRVRCGRPRSPASSIAPRAQRGAGRTTCGRRRDAGIATGHRLPARRRSPTSSSFRRWPGSCEVALVGDRRASCRRRQRAGYVFTGRVATRRSRRRRASAATRGPPRRVAARSKSPVPHNELGMPNSSAPTPGGGRPGHRPAADLARCVAALEASTRAARRAGRGRPSPPGRARRPRATPGSRDAAATWSRSSTPTSSSSPRRWRGCGRGSPPIRTSRRSSAATTTRRPRRGPSRGSATCSTTTCTSRSPGPAETFWAGLGRDSPRARSTRRRLRRRALPRAGDRGHRAGHAPARGRAARSCSTPRSGART